MSANMKKLLNELFTDDSNIFDVEKLSEDEYRFSDGNNKFKVRLFGAEIIFSYWDDYNEMWMTSPTKNNKNNFKILNTVVYCFKEIIKNNKLPKIFFTGSVNNGLAKLYTVLFKKLKDFIIENGYVGFYTDDYPENHFFLIDKNDFDFEYWDRRFVEGSLIGYTPGENMKEKIKECTTISMVNSNGTTVSITSDDMDELSQIMRNAGLGDYLEFKDNIGDLPPITNDETEVVDTVVEPEDEVIDYSMNEIPPYEYDTDDYDFGIGDTGYEVEYDDPLDGVCDEIGYSVDGSNIVDNTVVDTVEDQTGYFNVSNAIVDDVIDYIGTKIGIEPVEIVQAEAGAIIYYSTPDMYSLMEFLPQELINLFPGMIYGAELLQDGYVNEVAELNASVPYDEDAEESLFNIKGTAHQSNLRYVPGMMSDNPMTDELRESIQSEIPDAKSFVENDIDLEDVLDCLNLGALPYKISTREETRLYNVIADYMYNRYIDEVYNGDRYKTSLTPFNFVSIASKYFQAAKIPLEDEGFSFEIPLEESTLKKS